MYDPTMATDSHPLRPHPIDNLISSSRRVRLAKLDPLLNLDRLARMITAERHSRSTTAA